MNAESEEMMVTSNVDKNIDKKEDEKLEEIKEGDIGADNDEKDENTLD